MEEVDKDEKDSSAKRPQFGGRYLPTACQGEEEAVYRHNAWDDVEWSLEQVQEAKKAVEKNSVTLVPEDRRRELESGAADKWDAFYSVHDNKFFKDRNWLFTEMPELDTLGQGPRALLELGCGSGSTVYPILEAVTNPELRLHCCDFSAKAVHLVRENKAFDSSRCNPFVLDATDSSAWSSCPVEENSLDFVLMIFAISAMEPDKMPTAIKEAARRLKPGGVIFFRDYGQYDLAQLRFKDGRCLADNFYVRGDETRCYFFRPEEVTALFAAAGLEEVQSKVDRRLQVNRGKKLKMYRVWIQGKYRKPER